MDPPSLLDYIDKLGVATVLVGLLGFLGVMWTIRENARLGREQDDRARQNEAERRAEARRHEAETLAAVVQAELALLRTGALNNRAILERAVAERRLQARFPCRTETPIIDANLGRLGLFPQTTIRRVLAAYSRVRDIERIYARGAAAAADGLATVAFADLEPTIGSIDRLCQTLDEAIAAVRQLSPPPGPADR